MYGTCATVALMCELLQFRLVCAGYILLKDYCKQFDLFSTTRSKIFYSPGINFSIVQTKFAG